MKLPVDVGTLDDGRQGPVRSSKDVETDPKRNRGLFVDQEGVLFNLHNLSLGARRYFWGVGSRESPDKT